MAGERSVTMKEVARHAGVASSTVSRALSGHADVSAEMRRRVANAAAELGYEPDFLGQSLRRGTTNLVGFVVRDIANPLFAEIVKGAETQLRREGYYALLMNSLGERDLDAANIDILRKRRVDGLILSLQSERHPDTVRALKRLQMPVVLLDREVKGLRCGVVLCDHVRGVQDAVADLLSHGHTRIGLLSGPADILASRERVEGFRRAFQAAGLPVPTGLIKQGSYSRDAGYRLALDLLDGPEVPSALVAGGIQLGTGMFAAVAARGCRVPEDLAVVVCDEVEWMDLLHPSVSTVSRDSVRMGELAALLLIDMLRNPNKVRTEVVPTRYVPRESTAARRRVKSTS